jgi:cyclopropane fatty-acyl-phospholipid synthase-like methyltransferase
MLSIAEAAKKMKNCYPIFSQNRIRGDLVFTIVPYARPISFDLAMAASNPLTYEELLEKIQSVDTLTTAHFPSLEILQEKKDEANLTSTEASKHVVEYLDHTNFKGRVLDLGSGVGINTFLFLKNGWKVDAVDVSDKCLTLLQAGTYEYHSGLTIEKNDFTEMEFETAAYDVIIAIDSLPYTPKKDLLSLFRKIHKALKPEGLFMGSLFTFKNEEDKFSDQVMFLKALNAHFINDESIPEELLRYFDEDTRSSIEFTGRKI